MRCVRLWELVVEGMLRRAVGTAMEYIQSKDLGQVATLLLLQRVGHLDLEPCFGTLVQTRKNLDRRATYYFT
jgi:hypothetical protein